MIIVVLFILSLIGSQQGSSPSLGGVGSTHEAALEAFRHGELVPNRGLVEVIDPPSFERFAIDLKEGTYRVGTVIRLRDLELTEHPSGGGSTGIYDYSFQTSLGHYIPLLPIISNGDFARQVIDATPDMGNVVGHRLGEGSLYATYIVPEIVGVVEPSPSEFSNGEYALVLTRLRTKHTLVRHPDVKWAG